MKELMVTLLVFSCTGMVWAQQDNGNGFRTPGETTNTTRFGSSDPESSIPIVPVVDGEDASAGQSMGRPTRDQSADRHDSGFRARNSFPASRTSGRTNDRSETSRLLDPNRRARESFQSGSTDGTSSVMNRQAQPNSQRNRVIYLGLPQEATDILLESGRVVAPVKNPYVDRIKISDQNTPKPGPTRTIRPQLIDNSLVFTFTREDVDFIHEGSLEFEVPAHMKNRYTTATIEIPEILNRSARTSSVSRTTATRDANSGFRSDDRRWRLASDTNVREPNRQNDPWASNQPLESERERRQRLEYETWLREKQDRESREKSELANRNRELQAQLDRMRYEQQQAAARVQQQPIVYPQDRYAQNTQFNQMQPFVNRPVVPPANVDSVSYAMMQKMQQMEARVAQQDNKYRQLNNEFQNVKADRDDLLRAKFNYSNDSRNDLAQDRNRNFDRSERFADNPPVQHRPAIEAGGFGNANRRDVKSGTGGVIAGQVTKDSNGSDPWTLLLFLMLLISFGLNLYLWAISRGFYMRYQELADELRETFTVTA